MGKKSKAAAAAAAKKEKELSSSSSSSSTAAAAAKAEAESSNAGKDAPSALTYALYAVCFCAWVAAVYFASRNAYEIRLYAIKTYGKVIHEFDPWFNFRATQYLHMNGWTKFFHWYDYMSWYPLGRPVGTTIYPGMQISAVAIWHGESSCQGRFPSTATVPALLHRLCLPAPTPATSPSVALKNLNMEMTLNDVCVYMPAWYGVSATLFLGLLTSEFSGSWAAGAAGSIIYAIIPAHIMRSVGGGYDNESVALTCMCMTYYLWARSLRNDPKCKNGEATRDSYIFGGESLSLSLSLSLFVSCPLLPSTRL